MANIERSVLGSECPHCGKSNMLPEEDRECCHCMLPGPLSHTAVYYGDPIEATVPNKGVLSFLPAAKRISGSELSLHLVMRRRWHLYHFVEGLRFHLESCEKLLKSMDEQITRLNQ